MEMNIYEIKKELNGDKVLKEIKKNYKQITGNVVKIKIKKLDESETMEQLALVIEFDKGDYEKDYNVIASYWQPKKRALKEYKQVSYESFYETIKKIIINESDYDNLQVSDYDEQKGAFCQKKYDLDKGEWQFYYNKCNGKGWYQE